MSQRILADKQIESIVELKKKWSKPFKCERCGKAISGNMADRHFGMCRECAEQIMKEFREKNKET